MAIEKIIEFAKDGGKSTSGLNLLAGFPREIKPDRQWFNFLFNQTASKINEIIENVNTLLAYEPPIIEHYDIDDVFTTTKTYANGQAVAAAKGYGTWVKFAEGRTLVGHSSQMAEIAEYKTMGNEFGENEVTLTVEQIPPHEHIVDMYKGNIDGNARAGTVNTSDREGNIGTSSAGGGQAHNNIQPSKVVAYWLRTA